MVTRKGSAIAHVRPTGPRTRGVRGLSCSRPQAYRTESRRMSPTRTWRRAATRLVVVATVVAAWAPGLVSATPANAAITTAFAKVYSTNTTGDIMIRGNTVETCLTGAAGCAAAQQTAGP